MSNLSPADPQPPPLTVFYPRVAKIEFILLNSGLRSPAIYSGWSRAFKRTIPKRHGYLWDGLFNPSVFVSYVLEIGFLLVLAAIKPRLWQ